LRPPIRWFKSTHVKLLWVNKLDPKTRQGCLSEERKIGHMVSNIFNKSQINYFQAVNSFPSHRLVLLITLKII